MPPLKKSTRQVDKKAPAQAAKNAAAQAAIARINGLMGDSSAARRKAEQSLEALVGVNSNVVTRLQELSRETGDDGIRSLLMVSNMNLRTAKALLANLHRVRDVRNVSLSLS